MQYEINEGVTYVMREDGSREKLDPDNPKVETIYPVTIMQARYGGGYEGGGWLAFNCDPWDVPIETIGDDVTCANFFDGYNKSNRKKNPLKIGRGNTPDEALKDLVTQYYRV